jgi:hypothetical protein
LRPERLKSGANVCGACGKMFRAELFELPDEFSFAAPLGQGIEASSEAPCAVHPGNVAASHCARCGNFMCGLCETEFFGNTYCTACFERVMEEGQAAAPRRNSWNFQSLAGLCVLFVTGPVAVVLAWNSIRQIRREGLRDGSITRSVLLLFVGVLETLGMAAGAVLIVVQALGGKG